MVSVDEIEREILDLEQRDTTWAVVERLSWLYTVRDHLRRSDDTAQASSTAAVDTGGSEFKDICRGIDMSKVMDVIDAHMDAIKIVCPNEYKLVVGKLMALKDD